MASPSQQVGFGVAILLLTTLFATRRRRLAVAANSPDGRESAAVNAAAAKYLATVEAQRTPSPEELLLKRFFEEAPGHLCAIKDIFAEINQAPEAYTCEKNLAELAERVDRLSQMAEVTDLDAVSQLANGLKGLLRQMREGPSNFTPSALRTAIEAAVLLEDLCKPGLRHDRLTGRPVQLLAVDDDAISRHAISEALKKALPAPDLAESGTKALELASQNTYDVIFLDIQMPDLNGFEVCARIHQSAMNQTTPVVFVTGHSEFDSRTKAEASGGRDLIVKPLVSFDIVVKALTLVFRSRLERGHQPAPAPQVTSSEPEEQPKAGKSATVKPAPSRRRSESSSKSGNAISASYADGFAKRVCGVLAEMRTSLMTLPQEFEQAQLQNVLGHTYIGLNSLRLEAERLQLKAFLNLVDMTNKLIRKVLETPKMRTPSAANTVRAALEMLEKLCFAGPEMAGRDRSVRALVVDDDAIARRVMSNALQLCYVEPELAENGEAAIALGASKTFDVIFMDVLMPGMDGFETSALIRELGVNRLTPVVFVTSQTDATSRARALECNGSGFICKPALPAEIALMSLMFAIGRELSSNNSSKEA
jgi:CheY-like chemotaxis protein